MNKTYYSKRPAGLETRVDWGLYSAFVVMFHEVGGFFLFGSANY